MGKPCSCAQFTKSRFFTTSHATIRISTTSHATIRISTTSHARIRIRYYKSRENPYQVLQVTCAVSERPMKSKVRITRLLPLALLLVLRTRNNTDSNKLVIFSGIASYYGDNYIVSIMNKRRGKEGGGQKK